jgi:hypothetical protein
MRLVLKRFPIRGALAFTLPVLIVLGLTFRSNYYFLAAGPLCGIIGGLAFGPPFRRSWSLPIILGTCFAMTGGLFALQQDIRTAWFTDVVWVGLASGFLFWCIGACAVMVLPSDLRFRGAMSFAVPGAIAGMIFQFLYGPAHYLFGLGDFPYEHFALWLIAGAGTGWLLGSDLDRLNYAEQDKPRNSWAIASIACAAIGLVTAVVYFVRYQLPFGLFNSLSPSSAASDWLFGWGVLAGTIGIFAVMKKFGRGWAAAGLALATTLLVASYRVEADPWKSRFNATYAEKLLREHGHSGDAIYTANLILSQTALDKNDLPGAKRYLMEAAATTGANTIAQNGLETSVARNLLQRGERDIVLEYLNRGRTLWPQGAQFITRWEGQIKAGRMPNFNTRGPGFQN